MAGAVPFGKYQLLDRLAVGGMAEVFRAKATGAAGFEKDIAIKRILPQFSEDEDFVRMFIDEARLAAQLQHGNIVQIFDFDQVDGAYYIAMELVEGCDLRRVQGVLGRQSRRLPVALALYVAVETLKGLQYAHARKLAGRSLGIVHRDVSPHNILLSRSGEVKLSDFGIAKAHARATATRSGIVKGKLGYMSPEQVTGRPVDHRTDLFAVGVVLYEMLCGERLFQGDSEPETIALVQRCEIVPPSRKNPLVPPEVEKASLKLLAADPAARFESAGEALRALLSSASYGYDPEPLAALVGEVAPPVEPQPMAGGTRPLQPQAPATADLPPRSTDAPAAPLAGGTRLLGEQAPAPGRTPHRPPPPDERGSGSVSVQPVVLQREPGPAGSPSPSPSATRWLVGPLVAAVCAVLTYGVGTRLAVPRSPETHAVRPLPPAPDAAPLLVAAGGSADAGLAAVAPDPAAPVGRLRVTSRPTGAEIRLNGQRTGRRTPDVVEGAVGATARLELDLPGYEPWRRDAAFPQHELRVTAGLRRQRTGPPPPAASSAAPPSPQGRGLLSVYVRPWALVSIDGKQIKQTPLTDYELPAGAHQVELSNPDFPPIRKQVVVAPGHPAEIHEKFE